MLIIGLGHTFVIRVPDRHVASPAGGVGVCPFVRPHRTQIEPERPIEFRRALWQLYASGSIGVELESPVVSAMDASGVEDFALTSPVLRSRRSMKIWLMIRSGR